MLKYCQKKEETSIFGKSGNENRYEEAILQLQNLAQSDDANIQ